MDAFTVNVSSSSSTIIEHGIDPEQQRAYGTIFRSFLEDTNFDHGTYVERVEDMLLRGQDRLIININDLRESMDPAQFQSMMLRPAAFLYAFETELSKYIHRLASDDTAFSNEDQKHQLSLDDDAATTAASAAAAAERDFQGGSSQPNSYKHYKIGFEGSFGGHKVSPRSLNSELLGQLVCVEGIVTKVGLVRPKVQSSVHWCELTSEIHVRSYRDLTALVGAPTPSQYPKADKDGNPLSTEFGYCTYQDHQIVTIQEMPESAPPGQLPRSVEVILEHDLADCCKAGDRVRLVGIYRAFPAKPQVATVAAGGSDSRTTFRTRILANSVSMLNKDTVGGSVFTDVDIERIRDIAAAAARDPKPSALLDRLAGSIAPSIFGHQHIKKALLLVLMGGEEKNLANGTHIRGDMNMLMIGDPSTAKSQLLRFVLNLAPLAISTSGRGSSGVGLTAAVTHDTETGERRLEAGAMVLADRGVVCIDEFDKMSEEDRVSIHEVMEQQTVTIAKAGIHASLNARCSVIAAANPIYGQYNRHKKPTENIGLPDSLLSRFDLLFIVLDTMSPERDRSVAEHVLRMHRYRDKDSASAGAAGGGHPDPGFADERRLDQAASASLSTTSAAFFNQSQNEHQDPIYQPYDRLLHAHRDRNDPIFSVSFLKKYILYAKHRIHPVLTDEARDFITQAFAELRGKEQTKTLPVTPRSLETMIRLSAAAARVRLSNQITRDDAATALELMNFSLFHEAEPVVASNDSSSSSSSSSSRTILDDEEEDDHVATTTNENTTIPSLHPSMTPEELSDRIQEFNRALNHAMRFSSEIALNDLIKSIANANLSQPFSQQEIKTFLHELEEEGKITFSENMIIRL